VSDDNSRAGGLILNYEKEIERGLLTYMHDLFRLKWRDVLDYI